MPDEPEDHHAPELPELEAPIGPADAMHEHAPIPPALGVPHQEALFADVVVLRTLFQRYREARERLELAQEDFDVAHDNEDVMLHPTVFAQACESLHFRPTVDLFANAQHHQVSRYMAPRSDPRAAAIDAFTQDWRRERRAYANPPWSLIAQVLAKVAAERIIILMVVPEWRRAPWYAQWEAMCVSSVLRTDSVFLDDRGQLRSKPRWHTRIGVLDGARA